MRTGRNVFKYTILVFITFNLVLMLWVLFGATQPPRAPLPNPNGYDDFVKAAQLLLIYGGSVKSSNQNQVAWPEEMSKEELRTLVASNAVVFKLVETGLSRESGEPIEYTASYAEGLLPRLSSFKGLERSLIAAGRLAEMEGRTNDAINFYLEGVRFGLELERGGLVISRLVGIACEAMALKPLSSLANNLDAQKSRELGRALEAADAKEEPVERTLATEKLWSRKTYGIRGQIEKLLTYKQLRKNLDSLVAKNQTIELQRRWLIVNLAARAYELEKGKRPQNVAELVPEYLKAVPKDPATGKDLSLLGR